jgi:transposase
MGRYVAGHDRSQCTLFAERLDDWLDEDSTVRVIDVFVEELDLMALGFERAEPAVTGRHAYHPATLLKIYIYGYLNRIQSSRRLEAEAQRNVELIWLTQRLALDFKTIADFRKDNGEAIRKVCRECPGARRCESACDVLLATHRPSRSPVAGSPPPPPPRRWRCRIWPAPSLRPCR